LNSTTKEKSFFYLAKPWLGSIMLIPIMIYIIFNRGNFLFIDFVNLLIHEGGHGVFSFFGKFIHALGGTLMQIIIPGMFVVYYLFQKKTIAAQIFIVWLAQNLINISVYAADARARKLPLLGGNKVYHDWNYLLGETGMLEHDKFVGDFFFVMAIVLCVAVLFVPLIKKRENTVEINLDL
jgi:hypothetical protein